MDACCRLLGTNDPALVAQRVLVRFAMLSSGCKGEKSPAQSMKLWDTCVCVCARALTRVLMQWLSSAYAMIGQ